MGGHINPLLQKTPMSANRYHFGGAGLRARRHFGLGGRRAHPAAAVAKLALGLVLALLLAGGARAGDAFETARPGRVWSFPRDHGAHPEFKTEWWYYVGHLKAASGESFGYQLTFFRVALRKLRKPDHQARSAWSLHTVYFAHLALTDAARHTFVFQGEVRPRGLGFIRGGGGNPEGLDRRLASGTSGGRISPVGQRRRPGAGPGPQTPETSGLAWPGGATAASRERLERPVIIIPCPGLTPGGPLPWTAAR